MRKKFEVFWKEEVQYSAVVFADTPEEAFERWDHGDYLKFIHTDHKDVLSDKDDIIKNAVEIKGDSNGI